jgi:Phage integrase family.
MTVVLGKWDTGLDFNDARIRLETLIRNTASYLNVQTRKDKILGKKFVYASIAYVQLMNGSRVSEAIAGLREYIKTGKDEFTIIAGKTKVARIMKIPKLLKNYRYLLMDYSDILFSVNRFHIYHFLKKEFGWNPHALRYAFIRYAIERGYSAEILALVLGHKNRHNIKLCTKYKS